MSRPTPALRNLRLLRIDDGLLLGVLGRRMDSPPDFVDLFTVQDDQGDITAINLWRTAVRFWRALTGPPRGLDLVVSDVLFEADDSSPLRGVPGSPLSARPIPTGLSHLKSFAALMRAGGTPMGIAIHTKNPNLWPELMAQNHPMAALAAHEIGELAAILGDDLGVADPEQTFERNIARCWDWLTERTADDFRPALSLALEDYRRRLALATDPATDGPRVLVPPRDWQALAGWVHAKALKPGPVPKDLALGLLYADGRRDQIRVASLFAEVPGLTTVTFPAACYDMADANLADLPGVHSLWEMKPQFGRFVAALGQLNETAAAAADIVDRFPKELPVSSEDGDGVVVRTNLGNEAAGQPNEDLVAGLAILFQAVRWEHGRFAAWQDCLTADGWLPRKMAFDGGDSLPLSSVLESLAKLARRFGDRPFLIEDLLENEDGGTFNWPHPDKAFRGTDFDKTWFQWHLQRLIAARCVRQVPFDEGVDANLGVHYQWVAKFYPELAPAPDPMPKGAEWTCPAVKDYLRQTLGYSKEYGPGADDWNIIGRKLGLAFCGLNPGKSKAAKGKKPKGKKAKGKAESPAAEGEPPATADGEVNAKEAGMKFFDDLTSGDGPPWVLELLRWYAETKLGWTTAACLPGWLRE